ncbi:SRPBCC family protein [Streptomyces sp. NPDC051921]|uniref:SRPBCC family protein n=1 Tax=Streptomyces sp. NPDC051921 TaxID=3155806 RepID=UPI003414BC00
MADRKGSERGAKDGSDAARGSGGSGGQKLLDRNPGANRLTEELESYLQARLEKALTGVGHRIGDAAEKVGGAHIGPRALMHVAGHGGKKLVEAVTPDKVSSATSHIAETASHAKDRLSHAKDTAAAAKDAIVDKVTPGDSDEPRSSASNAGKKNLTIIEDIDVGVPVAEAYNQWTQFQEFSQFAKGVVSVEQEDETTTQWQVKVAKSNRAFKGTITEQVPDERIAWTSEGAKGTTRGVVTFHPLGENLTKVLLVMEYYPKGIIEKAGSLVRAQGRRTRLDLKAFRTFVMMKGEATGSWRGEIRGGKVVAGPDEESDESPRDEAPDDEDDESRGEGGDEEDRDQEEDGGEPEDEYEAGEEPDEEYDEDEDEEDDEDDRPGAEAEAEEYDEEEEEEEEPEERYEDDEDEDDEAAEEEHPTRRSRKR